MVVRVGGTGAGRWCRGCGTAARAEHRLRQPDGHVGDAADVAAVLDDGGDQLAQAADIVVMSWRDGGATPAARSSGVS